MVNRTTILISGTPGTGKTTLASQFTHEYTVINLFEFAQEYNCIDELDEKRNSLVIDEDCLYNKLNNFLQNRSEVVIIEGHYADIVPEDYVFHGFVLSEEIEELKKRLVQRKYSSPKINENLQAEIMKVCLNDMIDVYGPERITELTAKDIKVRENIIREAIMQIV